MASHADMISEGQGLSIDEFDDVDQDDRLPGAVDVDDVEMAEVDELRGYPDETRRAQAKLRFKSAADRTISRTTRIVQPPAAMEGDVIPLYRNLNAFKALRDAATIRQAGPDGNIDRGVPINDLFNKPRVAGHHFNVDIAKPSTKKWEVMSDLGLAQLASLKPQNRWKKAPYAYSTEGLRLEYQYLVNVKDKRGNFVMSVDSRENLEGP